MLGIKHGVRNSEKILPIAKSGAFFPNTHTPKIDTIFHPNTAKISFFVLPFNSLTLTLPKKETTPHKKMLHAK